MESKVEPSVTIDRGTIYLRTLKIPLRLATDKSPRFILCISQDITEELQMKDRFERERLMSLQTAKLASLGEMSAGIAHEINNPLAVISGMVEMIKRDTEDSAKRSTRIESIEKSVGRISKIVTGLRKFSRASDGQPRQQAVLADIVVESLVFIESKAMKSGVEILLDIQSMGTISCDPIEIEQVIINLVNNAVDANRGKMDSWIKIQLQADGSDLILRIEDSGSGISPEIESKLFQPFFTTKAVGEGTGLGLSISKGILDTHKASIILNRNRPNTCFEIRFPIISAVRPKILDGNLF